MDSNTVYKSPEDTSDVLLSTSDKPGCTPLLPAYLALTRPLRRRDRMAKLSEKRLYLTRHGQAEHKFVRIA